MGIQVGTQWLICLIPASLPLPEWYTTPDKSQSSRLQTLAMEWSTNLLPSDLEAGTTVTVAVDNLKQEIIDRQPADWAATIELTIAGSGESSGTTPAGRLLLVWPVAQGPVESKKAESTAPAGETAAAAEPTAASAAPQAKPAPPPRPAPRANRAPAKVESPFKSPRTKRLVGLPMTVRVELASKKIEMRQLTAISPGSLITFNKSCEDLLDLYVNNERYCRGEAIKIGEKFGLKVTEVGVVEVRQSRIIN